MKQVELEKDEHEERGKSRLSAISSISVTSRFGCMGETQNFTKVTSGKSKRIQMKILKEEESSQSRWGNISLKIETGLSQKCVWRFWTIRIFRQTMEPIVFNKITPWVLDVCWLRHWWKKSCLVCNYGESWVGRFRQINIFTNFRTFRHVKILMHGINLGFVPEFSRTF